MLVGQTKQAPVFITSRKVDVLRPTYVLTNHGFEKSNAFSVSFSWNIGHSSMNLQPHPNYVTENWTTGDGYRLASSSSKPKFSYREENIALGYSS